MKRRVKLLIPLLILALVITAAGCGGDDDEEATPIPTLTPVPTQGGATPTPGAETPTPPVYTGESVEFRVSHQSLVGSTSDRMWHYIDEQLKYYTNGECRLEIYPASSLYRGLEEWDALVTGALDMMSVSSWQPTMQGMMDWQMPFMGFFWGVTKEDSAAHWERFAEHPEGGQKLLKQLEDDNLKGLWFYPGSGLTMNLNKRERVKQLRDMKGWKNMSVGGFSDILVKACGLTPVFIDPAEQQIAFEQGLIDSINIDPCRVLATKLYDTANYGLTSNPTAPGGSCIGMSLELWDSLSPELQDIWINKIKPDHWDWMVENSLPEFLRCLEELKELGFIHDHIPYEERVWLGAEMWRLGWELGYIGEIDHDMLKLADALRNEPYDQTELPFPDES